MSSATKNRVPPIHQWTHDGDHVIVVVSVTGTPGGEGKLIGWPWGLGMDPNFWPKSTYPLDVHRIFSLNMCGAVLALPKQVVPLGHGRYLIDTEIEPDQVTALKGGCLSEVLPYICEGQEAWLQHYARGYVDDTPYYQSGAALELAGVPYTNRENQVASSARETKLTMATGRHSVAVATHLRTAATAKADSSVAATTRESSTSSTYGLTSVAATTSTYGVAVTQGKLSVAVATEYGGAAIAEGDRSIAVACHGRNYVAARGNHSVAVVTGEKAVLDVAPGATGFVLAERFIWKQKIGATVIHRWNGGLKVMTAENSSQQKFERGEKVMDWTT